jgi:hypothetical protein
VRSFGTYQKRKGVEHYCLVLSIVALALCPDFFSAAAASDKALFLKQSSASIGSSESYLTSHAIRININDKSYLIAKAPTWRVVLFNSSNKTGMQMSYQQWISHHPKWNHGKDVDWVPSEHLLKVASPKVDGRLCTDYLLAELLPNGQLVAKQAGTSGHLLVTKVEGVAAQAIHVLQRTLDLPQTADLPLRLTLIGKERQVEGMKFVMGGDAHLLATKVIKTAEVDPAIFTYPKNFKVVDTEIAVLYDSKTINSNVEQFLDAFK